MTEDFNGVLLVRASKQCWPLLTLHQVNEYPPERKILLKTEWMFSW